MKMFISRTMKATGMGVGIREMGLFLMLFSCLHLPAPSYSSSLKNTTLNTGFMHESNVGDKRTNEKLSIKGGGERVVSIGRRVGGANGGHGGGFGAIQGGGGTSGGTSPGNADNGNRGNSRSPGSTTLIPIYAAGAASNRHKNHHNAGNRNHCSIELTKLRVAILASLVFYLHGQWM